ncbi:MAG: hypothetical protein NVS1B4_15800 [Gemmatimonadaceae bacterium]
MGVPVKVLRGERAFRRPGGRTLSLPRLVPPPEHDLVGPDGIANIAQKAIEFPEITLCLDVSTEQLRIVTQVAGDGSDSEWRHRASCEVALDACYLLALDRDFPRRAAPIPDRRQPSPEEDGGQTRERGRRISMPQPHIGARGENDCDQRAHGAAQEAMAMGDPEYEEGLQRSRGRSDATGLGNDHEQRRSSDSD